MDEQQLLNEKLKQMKKKTRKKSYTKPELSSINELFSTDYIASPPVPGLSKSICDKCGYENSHIMRQFICKKCKTMHI